MRTELADYIDKMQHIADNENITIQARHIDLLDYYFKIEMTPKEAVEGYKEFLSRWNAITDNGKNTEQ